MADSQLSTTATCTVQAVNYNGDPSHRIELSPCDLRLLLFEYIQKGLLFHHNNTQLNANIVQHLKNSLSTTLHFFPPLAGRLAVDDDGAGNASFSIVCNNLGALFVHAIVENTTVADILQPTYVPRIVHSFFPLNGVLNYEGKTKPLLAVQVTELVDGIFIACSINHVVGDGASFWHFFNSWAEISRGSSQVSKPPTLHRWFPDDIIRPIRIPFPDQNQHHSSDDAQDHHYLDRVFHFAKQKIAELKAKANEEISYKSTISSLQAVLAHLWRSIIRGQHLDPHQEVKYRLAIGFRPRLHSPLPDNYFGNALWGGLISMKAGEVLEGGLGKVAWEMNKMVASYTAEKIKSVLGSWLKNPTFSTESSLAVFAMLTSSSPRFDVYGNDFGWGRPVAVRSGASTTRYGKITVHAGAEEGSIDIEVCLPFGILEAMGNDSEFMDAVSKQSL